MRIITALALVVLTAPAFAQSAGDLTITFSPGTGGGPRVIDGDTFDLDGEVIRLWGIDAPDLDQPCGAENSDLATAFALFKFSMLLSHFDECERLATDPEGHTIAQCWTVTGHDIAEILVASGLAFEDTEVSGGHYASALEIAQEDDRGIWQQDVVCEPPWEWRAGT